MIQIIKRRRTKRLDMDNGHLNKPIRQICKNCNCTLSISNIFDFYIKKNCYADPFYMIDPYELAFKCPNCRCEVTLSGFNDTKIRKFLKRHNTDIYDLRDYIEYREWFKYQKYTNPNTIKGKALEQLAQRLYRLVYKLEVSEPLKPEDFPGFKEGTLYRWNEMTCRYEQYNSKTKQSEPINKEDE